MLVPQSARFGQNLDLSAPLRWGERDRRVYTTKEWGKRGREGDGREMWERTVQKGEKMKRRERRGKREKRVHAMGEGGILKGGKAGDGFYPLDNSYHKTYARREVSRL